MIIDENILNKWKDMTKSKSNFCGVSKMYAQICSTLGWKYSIKHPTRMAYHTSTLIDYRGTNCEENLTKSGIINTSLSDHQLYFLH